MNIYHNKATHPNFDWEVAEHYYLYSHGGARKGAGRKPSPNPKQTFSFYITKEAKEQILQLREAGYDTNALMEDFLDFVAKSKNK